MSGNPQTPLHRYSLNGKLFIQANPSGKRFAQAGGKAVTILKESTWLRGQGHLTEN